MLGVDNSLLGHDVPGRIGPLLQLQHPIVLDHRRAALLGRAGVGPDRACRVDVALAVGPHAAEHALDIDDGAAGLDFLRRHQPNVLDADRLEAAIRRLQPFPALRRGSHVNAAGHVHADRLAGFGLHLLQEVDRIGLEERHVGIGVERVEIAGGVPGRARGQDRALDQRDVAPAELRQMVKRRRPRRRRRRSQQPDSVISYPRAPVPTASIHAMDQFRARLDNDVQTRARSDLSASVAFVALSEETEYEYGWLSAPAATVDSQGS